MTDACTYSYAGLCTETGPALCCCLHCSRAFCGMCYVTHEERAARQVAAGLYTWRGR